MFFTLSGKRAMVLITFNIFWRSKMKNSNTSVAIKSETYDLPENAKVGGIWNLPKGFIFGIDNVNAPHWDFDYPEFTAFIKAVKRTDEHDVLEVEYWVYRSNNAYCSNYYCYWDKGIAKINTSTHRRWNVA